MFRDHLRVKGINSCKYSVYIFVIVQLCLFDWKKLGRRGAVDSTRPRLLSQGYHHARITSCNGVLA